jgi:hypothetical protein
MIIGTFGVARFIEESVCRNTEDYEFSEIGDYKIHSTTIMPLIPFEESKIEPYQIDSSIFINDEETKLEFEKSVKCQNFLTTNYSGRAPLEFYGPKTKMGREFLLLLRDGNPNYSSRIFGTEDSIRGYNRNANENIKVPKPNKEKVKE